MATQDCSESSVVLLQRAKELLKKDDFERLKSVMKTFSKTRSVEGLCSDLLKIVDSRSKVDILVEVRRCLPQNQRNKFTRHCNQLLEAEAEQEGEDFGKKRKMRAKERENTAPKFQCSPAKKTRPGREKGRNSTTEKILLQGHKKSGPGFSNEATSLGVGARNAGVPDIHILGSHQEDKVIVIERKSLNQGFGLRIRGGTFHHPSITVAQVAKNSLADRQGLKTGDRIIRVNDQRCGRYVNISRVIGIIKASKTLRMRIISSETVTENDGKNQGFVQAKGYEPVSKAQEKRSSTISVYPSEDGWLGCCIRGGADYACDVHVISVDNHSPAEKAGLKAGDVIVKVNGINSKDLTHVQVVRLVVMSGSRVTFSVRPGSKQNKRLGQELVRVRPTPLRTHCSGPNVVTPPGSPTSRAFHLPGYQQKHCSTLVNSPSQLHLDVLNLDCMPPPPYTPEVPLRHRVLARGEEGHDVKEEQEEQCTHFEHKPQLNQDHQKPQANLDQEEPQVKQDQQKLQRNHDQQEPQDSHEQPKPQGNHKEQKPKGNHKDQKPQGHDHQQEPQDSHSQLESLGAPERQPLNISCQQQLSDGNEASFDRNLENIQPQGCSVMEQDCAPCPILIPEEAEILSEEKKALINKTASPSPVPSNGRESFLSQIRQFNKAKLKKLALHPEDNSNELHRISRDRNHNPDDQMQKKDDKKDSPHGNSPHENPCSMDLLSALNQAMKHRARVLHDTLSSVDEGESSDDDDNDDDDEWEL